MLKQFEERDPYEMPEWARIARLSAMEPDVFSVCDCCGNIKEHHSFDNACFFEPTKFRPSRWFIQHSVVLKDIPEVGMRTPCISFPAKDDTVLTGIVSVYINGYFPLSGNPKVWGHFNNPSWRAPILLTADMVNSVSRYMVSMTTEPSWVFERLYSHGIFRFITRPSLVDVVAPCTFHPDLEKVLKRV